MSSARAPTDRLARLLDLAQAVLDDPTTNAGDLAQRAHLSRFHFARVVTATAGEPPGAMRRRLLLERSAHELLRDPNRTVLDVAVGAGYGSHEAFTRAFARAFGRTPSSWRHQPPTARCELELDAPNGVHFHPPGGLRLPPHRQETDMDVLQQLVDHHVDSLASIIEAAERFPAEVLDRPITCSVELVDDDTTLRSLLHTMVTQEEHWLSALRRGDWPDESDQTLTGLRRRHTVAGREYRSFVAGAIAEQRMSETFVDTTCEPPTTHTFAGIVAHVVTFAAVRRTLAVGALWTAGLEDISLADPRPALDALVTPEAPTGRAVPPA